MKIVKRIDFVKLPPETLFSEYEPCWFGPLMIKGDTLDGNNDWCEQAIADAIESKGDDYADILLHAQETGESIGMDFDCQGRDGCFDEDSRLYAVWEPQDVRHLVNRLQRCLQVTSTGGK